MTYSGRMEDGWSLLLAVRLFILSWTVLARLPVSTGWVGDAAAGSSSPGRGGGEGGQLCK